MKRLILVGVFVFVCAGVADAAPYVFTAYDGSFYNEQIPTDGNIGAITAISDTYYTFDIKAGTVQVSQTEWVSCGDGCEVVASHSPSVFNYLNVTFENMQSVFGSLMSDSVYADLFAQFGAALLQDVPAQNKAGAISKHTKNLYYTNIGLIENRMARDDIDASVWGIGSYNYAKQSGANDFSDNTSAISVGVDKYINDNFMLGAGYSFNNSDIKADANTIESDGHNVYLYGKYKFGRSYVNGFLNYGFAKYNEENFTDLMTVDADHNVYNHGAMVQYGYEVSNGLRPEMGLRYIYIAPDSYTDSIDGKIAPSDTSTLTLVPGVKYNYDAKFLSLKLKFNLVYDIINQDEVITTNTYGYQQIITADNFNPFGIESGIAIEVPLGSTKLSLGYDVAVRDSYQSHTGSLMVKYIF